MTWQLSFYRRDDDWPVVKYFYGVDAEKTARAALTEYVPKSARQVTLAYRENGQWKEADQ